MAASAAPHAPARLLRTRRRALPQALLPLSERRYECHRCTVAAAATTGETVWHTAVERATCDRLADIRWADRRAEAHACDPTW